MSQLFNGTGITVAYGSVNRDSYYWSAQHLTITIDESVLAIDRAQMEVLENYRVSNLLPIRYTGGGRLIYSVTAKMPLSEMLAKRRITRSELSDIVYGILSALKEIEEDKVLTGAGLVFDERFIFVHPNKFTPLLMYLPVYREGADLSCLMRFIYELVAPSKLEETGEFAGLIRELIQSGVHSLKAFEEGFGTILNRTPSRVPLKSKNPNAKLSINDLPLPKEITAGTTRKDIINEVRLWCVFILSNGILALLFCWMFLPDLLFLQHLTPAKEVPYLSNVLFSGDGFSLRGFIVVSALFLTIELILCLMLFGGVKSEKKKIDARKKTGSAILRNQDHMPEDHSAVPRPILEPAPQIFDANSETSPNIPPPQPVIMPEYSQSGAIPSDWEIQPLKSEPGISVMKSQKPASHTSVQSSNTDDTLVVVETDDTLVITEPPCPYLEYIVNGVPMQIFIRGERFLIGRVVDECHYISPDPMVGKRHAEILTEDGGYYIREIKAQNHTYLSGVSYGETEIKLEQNKKYPLYPDVKIRMALDSVFTFRI